LADDTLTSPTLALGVNDDPRSRRRWRGLGEEAHMAVLMASDYPFLDIFWTILVFMAWVIWIWMVITVLMDVFRRRDMSGWGKAAWTVFVIVLPFLGVLVYLIGNHDGMADRSGRDAAASQAQFDEYVRQTAGSGGPAAEIESAQRLRDSGTITQAEFDAIKENAIGAATAA
jgi:Phospholipase_D-nuclease N-terminal